jgi:hypothetical protein
MNITGPTYEGHFPYGWTTVFLNESCYKHCAEKIQVMFTKNLLMHLRIAPNRLISDLQHEFNKAFPFLKIEFFQNRNKQLPAFTFQQILPHNKRIAEGQAAVADGDIEISPDMKVKDLEKMFKDQFSLVAQVFRRSGNLWLETTMTDDWTLGQQNEHGREISTDSKKDISRENDYDLSRDADH